VAPDLLLFDTPRSAQGLRSDRLYDGLILPFTLRLEAVDVVEEHAPRQVLYLEGPDGKRQEVIAPGARLSLGEASLEVESIGPWEGLVRDPRGQAMAAFELPATSATSGRLVFMESGQITILRPDLAVCFLWHGSESEARQALVPSLADVPGARWGVRDGQAIQWFENFIPGSGLVLSDGTPVTLKSAARGEGRITVQIQRSAGRELKEVSANAASPDGLVLYEDPAGTGQVLYLHAWREGAALGRLLRRGEGAKDIDVQCGTASEAPVLLKQVMGQALAVPEGSVRAARVRLGENTVVLREGLAETVGEYRLRYQMEPVPPEARYRIAVLDPEGRVQGEHRIEGAEVFREGAWVFTLSPENPFAPRGVALTAERRPSGLEQTIGLGLFVLGSFGLVLARFGRRS
jgi:hypothetical protein